MTDSLGRAVDEPIRLRLSPTDLTCFVSFLLSILFAFFGIFDRCAHLQCMRLIRNDSCYLSYGRNLSLT